MKRALVITYYWPPAGGSGVQRWVKFAKYLPAEGWEAVIYTPENPEAPGTDTTLLEDIPQGTEVIRTHISEIYGIYRKFSKGGSGQVNPINQQKKSLKQRLAMWVRGNLFIPDPRVSWVKPSVRFLKKYLKEHPVDVIVSTGPPHSMHLIARGVAKATGIPWVADFRDPWTKLFYFKHLQLSERSLRKHRALEQQVLDDATLVVAVSPLVQEEFEAMTKTPVKLVTNGFDPEDFVPAEAAGVKAKAGAGGATAEKTDADAAAKEKASSATAKAEANGATTGNDSATAKPGAATAEAAQADVAITTKAGATAGKSEDAAAKAEEATAKNGAMTAEAAQADVAITTKAGATTGKSGDAAAKAEEATAKTGAMTAGAGGAFELVHTGLFAVDGNPERLWRVLREKCLEDREFARRMRITLAGKTDREVAAAIVDAGLGENLRDLGYQSHTEVVKLQKEAAVLLLPLRKEPEYRATLPGKLFEYLGARRPILGIGQTDGAMARVLAETASGRTFEWTDDKGIRQYIDSCWESFKAGKLEVPPRDISRYSRPATARQMAQIFDSLI
ncbi:MAG: glycosyltransferase [Bacteroidales bacterium]|nr:glycosyltransferase [Bacteroidales bacterium]